MTDWPHAPPHRLTERGVYMVTSGTYRKRHLFNSCTKLDLFRELLFEVVAEAHWQLHAWAILSNHYHLIASSPAAPSSLRRLISKLHTLSARDINRLDGRSERKVWFQYFDSHITFTNSYLPRLKHVHQNPLHHGVVQRAELYPWCSASWFCRKASPSFRKTVESFKIDRLTVVDPFTPECAGSAADESGVKPPHSKIDSPLINEPVQHEHSKTRNVTGCRPGEKKGE